MFTITIGFIHVVVHVIGNSVYAFRSTSCAQKGASCVSLSSSLFGCNNWNGNSTTIDLVSVDRLSAVVRFAGVDDEQFADGRFASRQVRSRRRSDICRFDHEFAVGGKFWFCVPSAEGSRYNCEGHNWCCSEPKPELIAGWKSWIVWWEKRSWPSSC